MIEIQKQRNERKIRIIFQWKESYFQTLHQTAARNLNSKIQNLLPCMKLHSDWLLKFFRLEKVTVEMESLPFNSILVWLVRFSLKSMHSESGSLLKAWTTAVCLGVYLGELCKQTRVTDSVRKKQRAFICGESV